MPDEGVESFDLVLNQPLVHPGLVGSYCFPAVQQNKKFSELKYDRLRLVSNIAVRKEWIFSLT